MTGQLQNQRQRRLVAARTQPAFSLTSLPRLRPRGGPRV